MITARSIGLDALIKPASACRLPLEAFRGLTPENRANCLPEVKRSKRPTSARITQAVTGPTPGNSRSRFTSASFAVASVKRCSTSPSSPVSRTSSAKCLFKTQRLCSPTSAACCTQRSQPLVHGLSWAGAWQRCSRSSARTRSFVARRCSANCCR